MKEKVCDRVKKQTLIKKLSKHFSCHHINRREEILPYHLASPSYHTTFLGQKYILKPRYYEHKHEVSEHTDKPILFFQHKTTKHSDRTDLHFFGLIKDDYTHDKTTIIHTELIAKMHLTEETLTIYDKTYYDYFKSLATNFSTFTTDHKISTIIKCWEDAE